MSTNFYMRNEVAEQVEDMHIGKRYGAGNGQVGFIWAIEPKAITRICVDLPYAQLVVDEYGNCYTGKEFITIIDNCVAQEEMIGVEFS